jgi:hypothetical protein
MNLSPYIFSKPKNLGLLKNFKKRLNVRYQVVYFYKVYGKIQIWKGDMVIVVGIFEDNLKQKRITSGETLDTN